MADAKQHTWRMSLCDPVSSLSPAEVLCLLSKISFFFGDSILRVLPTSDSTICHKSYLAVISNDSF